jgi:hypothetical protein
MSREASVISEEDNGVAYNKLDIHIISELMREICQK